MLQVLCFWLPSPRCVRFNENSFVVELNQVGLHPKSWCLYYESLKTLRLIVWCGGGNSSSFMIVFDPRHLGKERSSWSRTVKTAGAGSVELSCLSLRRICTEGQDAAIMNLWWRRGASLENEVQLNSSCLLCSIPGSPGQRTSALDLHSFLRCSCLVNRSWIIGPCYASLMTYSSTFHDHSWDFHSNHESPMTLECFVWFDGRCVLPELIPDSRFPGWKGFAQDEFALTVCMMLVHGVELSSMMNLGRS